MLTEIRQAEDRATATIAAAKEVAEALKKQAHADAAKMVVSATTDARTAKETARLAGEKAGAKEATAIATATATEVSAQGTTLIARVEQVAAMVVARIVSGK